jgi:hypothetical protein
MAADVPDVLAQLAIIEPEVIDPITHKPVLAYPSAPFSLNLNDLPAFVNLPGPMAEDWEIKAGEDAFAKEGYETRTYFCYLYVAGAATGTPGEAFALVEPYFSLGRNMFESHQSLKNLAGIQRVIFQGDEGTQVLTYAGQPYYAIRFRVQIIGRVRVTLAQGE